MDRNKNQVSSPNIKWLSVAAWSLLIAVLWGIDLATKFTQRARLGVGLDDFRLIAEQVTSAIGVLVMVRFLYWWVEQFNLLRTVSAKHVFMTILGWTVFSLGHFSIMIMLRAIIYPFWEEQYRLANLHWNYLYELQKDLKIYIGMLVIIYALKYRQQTLSKAEKPSTTSVTRIKVLTGTGETFLALDDICYFSADRNYLTVHTVNEQFLMRKTLNQLQSELDSKQFVRVHRSHMVNLSGIKQLKKLANSGWVVEMITGQELPVSRTYLSTLRNISQLT